MADDRSGPGSADEVHDDDELADLLAAELQRYATGAVPTIPRPAPEPVLPVRPSVPARAAEPAARRPPERPPVPERPRTPPLPPVEDLLDDDDDLAGLEPPAARPAGRRAAPPAEPFGPPPPVETPPSAFERQGRRVADVLSWADPRTASTPTGLPAVLSEDQPVRRRSGYLPPGSTAQVPPLEPVDRVMPTGPVTLPEPTASLLQEMLDDSGDQRTPPAARRSVLPTAPAPMLPEDGAIDLLRGTGPVEVPPTLYTDWERSLRSIGRPRSPWDDDEDALPGGSEPDAPTVAIPVRTLPRTLRPVAEPAAPVPDGGEAERPDAPSTGRIRRSGRRRAPAETPPPPPTTDPIAIAAGVDADDEGIDDVAPDASAPAEPHHRVSAATTGAIDLPLTEPRPRTAPLLIERVRTAILQLPVVPPRPTGSGGAAIAGRWAGASFSPVLLLVATGLSAAGAGPAAGVLLLLGAVLVLPAVLRSVAWAAGAAPDAREEEVPFGRRGGTAWAVVLLLARVAAAAGSLFAIASTVSAWVARTGVLGGSASNAALAAVTVAGLAALAVAALPVRAAGVLTQLLAAAGVVGTVLLVLLLAPTAAAAPAAASGPVAAVTAGAAIGLLLALCGADVVRWRTDLATGVGAAVGTAVGAAAGVLVLALGLAVTAGAAGDPADALAAALSDGSAAGLAAPLAVVLLGAALVLPILLLRSAGAAASRLLGGGERLGVAAAGLLALASALGLLAIGAQVAPVGVALAGLVGVPVAAWAGMRTLGGTARSTPALIVSSVAVPLGWALADGLVPGVASPLLAAAGLPDASGLRGGPLLGLVVAFAAGLVAGVLSRQPAVPVRAVRDPADTVEG